MLWSHRSPVDLSTGRDSRDREFRVLLAADHEEGTRLRYPVESRKIEVAAIEDIDAPRLEEHLVNEMDIVQRTFREAYEDRNRADQIDLRVQFDRGLRRLEFRPRKH